MAPPFKAIRINLKFIQGQKGLVSVSRLTKTKDLGVPMGPRQIKTESFCVRRIWQRQAQVHRVLLRSPSEKKDISARRSAEEGLSELIEIKAPGPVRQYRILTRLPLPPRCGAPALSTPRR